MTQANVSWQQGLFFFVMKRDDTSHDQPNKTFLPGSFLTLAGTKVAFWVERDKECQVTTHSARGKKRKEGKPAWRGAC